MKTTTKKLITACLTIYMFMFAITSLSSCAPAHTDDEETRTAAKGTLMTESDVNIHLVTNNFSFTIVDNNKDNDSFIKCKSCIEISNTTCRNIAISMVAIAYKNGQENTYDRYVQFRLPENSQPEYGLFLFKPYETKQFTQEDLLYDWQAKDREDMAKTKSWWVWVGGVKYVDDPPQQ